MKTVAAAKSLPSLARGRQRAPPRSEADSHIGRAFRHRGRLRTARVEVHLPNGPASGMMRRMSRPREGFNKIRHEHVEQAFREVDAAGGAGGGGSYFVSIDGKELPAKRVLRVAYRIANGTEIPASAFSGGTFTAKVLEAVGVKVVVRTS